jgi:hypothetical protein
MVDIRESDRADDPVALHDHRREAAIADELDAARADELEGGLKRGPVRPRHPFGEHLAVVRGQLVELVGV